uniref:Transcription factor HES-5 n=1 Tax=Lates calcarifer TaxID=8187 RepID=A0A4W6FFT6_LATCA
MAPTNTTHCPLSLLSTKDRHKLRKPQVEKMRRDRINGCIEQLKVLLEEEFRRQDPNAKLEKADVLEMTVAFLKRRLAVAPRVAPSYSRGFSQCLQETLRHLSLHAPLRPAEREEIKRFYVRQRAALQRHVSGEQRRRTAARKRSGSRSAARCHGALWRPW